MYHAWTEPKLLQRWLPGPPSWTMPVCETGLRVGGRFRWVWRYKVDGTEFGFHRVFQEVDPPARIRHGEVYDPGSIGGDMTDGTEMSYQTLDTLLAEGGEIRHMPTLESAEREADEALREEQVAFAAMSRRVIPLPEGTDQRPPQPEGGRCCTTGRSRR